MTRGRLFVLWQGLALLFNLALAAPALADASSLPDELQSGLQSLKIDLKNVSLIVKEVNSERPMVSYQAAIARNPASVMKMFTTFAALSELGPGFQWQTDVRRTGLAENGQLNGDLIVVGGGDPSFLQENLWALVNQLSVRGIHTINGDLIVDESLFDLPDHDPGAFDGRQYRPYNVGPHAALFNFNAINFTLVPVAKPFVDIRVVPAVKGLEVVSRVKALTGACKSNRIRMRIAVEAIESGRQVMFTGQYPKSCGRYQLTRAVLPSNELLYGTLSTLLEERGGGLNGALLIGRAPSDSRKLMSLTSPTLSEVVRSTNKFSNNVMSQQLFLTLGEQMYGAPATASKGDTALRAVLSRQGIDVESLIIANGSGLCRQCRVTADTIVQLLDVAWHSPYMPEFIASLGVPGIDGSLKKRFPKGSYKGRVHMKTGTIDHVSAAAGYVQTRDNRRLQFALMINQENVHKGAGQAFQRRLMHYLVAL
ncbi:MAG: D-alanyl-D-alanine carboxypeptidase/D-alanyl-D-alanine-endopeptidase [Pseudomonadota bacterium]